MSKRRLDDGEAAASATPPSARQARAAKTVKSLVDLTSDDDNDDEDGDGASSRAAPGRTAPRAKPQPKAASAKLKPASVKLKPALGKGAAASRARDPPVAKRALLSGSSESDDDDGLRANARARATSADKDCGSGDDYEPGARRPSPKAKLAISKPRAPRPKSAAGSASAKYIKLTQREHVLHRPDTYIGSVARAPRRTWLVDADGASVRFGDVELASGFVKIFDEILTNALDRQYEDETMRSIAVTVDAAVGEITVRNSGRGIPVQMHDEHPGLYIPSLIFGEFLTGENFDDSKVRFIGGRNGIGAKATNVFSTRFEVEIVDPAAHLKFRQVWADNMATPSAPSVSAVPGGARGYVQVRFRPDFARFGMAGIDDEAMAVLRSRVYDAAACTRPSIKLAFNGAPVEICKFADYADLVLGGKGERARAYEKVLAPDGSTVRAEIVAAHAPAGFQCIAFVNGIRCCAGSHVEAIVGEICKQMVDRLATGRNKALTIKPYMVRNNLALVARLLVNNPTFDSQSKDKLCSPAREWGFKLTLSQRFVRELERTGLADAVLAYSELKERQTLSKDSAVRRNARPLIDKLDDALNAGKAGSNCTLLLTEGDSAKALAVAGISVVGRHEYGIFPLRGKPLNTRKVALKKLKENAEIAQLMRIVGLEYGKEYTTLASLRYKSITIFADQDLDGHHIAGLIINLIHSQWPSLLRICPDFIRRFATPIIKVTRGSTELGFFTAQEFAEWRAADASGGGGGAIKIKYLKGLGSSNNLDAKKYFSQLDEHVVVLRRVDEACDQALITAFDPDKADARKAWLRDVYDPDSYIDYGVDAVPIRAFFDAEFIHFSVHDNARSIPSVLDGLKPTQRKVMHVLLKRKQRQEVKVSQVAGGIAEATGYHHGEASLIETIVGMAQQHVGTNNINLLKPEGQFGSRLAKPSVHAQARYIFTALEPIATKVFRHEDEALLAVREDEGQQIEPEVFLPVVPLVLINGAAGIGTGWMTDVPCFHPLAVVRALEELIELAADGALGPADELDDDGLADALWDELVGEGHDGAAHAGDGVSAAARSEASARARTGGAPADVDTDCEDAIGSDGDPFGKEDETLGGLLRGARGGTAIGANSTDARVDGGAGADEEPAGARRVRAPAHTPRRHASPASDPHGPPRGPARDPTLVLEPWYDGFAGQILPDAAHLPDSVSSSYTAYGVWTVRSSGGGVGAELDTVEITELPIGRWTDDFVSELYRKHVLGGEKAGKDAFVKSVDNLSTECVVRLVLHCDAAALRCVLDSPGGLCKALRLSTPLRTSNMYLFDETRRLRRYRSAKEIVRAFFEWRRPLYAARHRLLDEQLAAQIELLAQQQRFVRMVASGELRMHCRTRALLDADLAAAGFKRIARARGHHGVGLAMEGGGVEPSAQTVADSDGDGALGADGGNSPSFAHLLRMPFLSLSQEKADELQAELDAVRARLHELRARTPLDLWLADLAELRLAYAAFVETRAARSASYDGKPREAGGRIRTKRSKRPAK